MYEAVARKLAAGEVVILDGGTGTHIQARGAPMDAEDWCAQANMSHPDVVKAVHGDYLAAGAEVITANTYATAPVLFDSKGRSDEVPVIDRTAVRLAHEAVDEHADRPIAIAGSMSVMRKVTAGADRTEKPDVAPGRARDLMKMKADVLAEAGCDLLVMEMLRDVDHSLIATEAAVATGLPVWVGISVERREDGKLAGFDNHHHTLAELVPALMATGAQACCVMHHEITLSDEAIAIIKSGWNGPFGVYPESGVFKMPHWDFGDIEADDFAAQGKTWCEVGATIVGGCCGVGPEHIKALNGAVHRG